MIFKRSNVLSISVALSLAAWGISHASDAAGSATSGGARWVNTVQPPVLENPVIIEISHNSKLSSIDDYDRVGCQGDVYRFTLPFDEDALVIMSPDM